MDALRRPAAIVVCPVIPFPAVSGSHKRTLRLIEAMEAAGARPHILSWDVAGQEGSEALRDRGWTVELIPFPPATVRSRFEQHLRRYPSSWVPAMAERLKELSNERVAFVQLEHTLTGIYAGYLAAPTILSLHNVDSEMLRSVARATRPLTVAWVHAVGQWRAMRATERRVVPRADLVLCVSRSDSQHFASRVEVQLIPNGVDEDLFELPTEPPPGPEIVLFFAQFGYQPNALGIARFLKEGWSVLAQACPRARLRLVGPGLEGQLEALARQQVRVDVVGAVDDLRAELAQARLVLVPLWQGGGTRLKVVEALAAARPVVGTPFGVEGLGFEHGKHGAVAETPTGIAAEAAALLQDDARRRAMAIEGRRLVSNYGWHEVTAPLRAIYGRYLERRMPTPVGGAASNRER